MIEGRLLAHQGVHAAHSGRKLRVLDIQFDIHRKLADAALRAQKVRTGNACRADDRWSGVPGIERDGHTDTATGAARPPGPRTSAVRLRPRPPLGAERLARPIPRLPDRSDRPYGAVQKQGRGIGLLLASLPDGSQQSFFFLLRPAAPLLLDRAESTDLFVEGHQVLAELLEAMKLGDLLLGFAQRS